MSTAVRPLDQIRGQIDTMKPQFAAALPAHISAEKFARVVMTAVGQSSDLQNADRASLFAASLKCATDGLIPDGREAAIVTFGKQAQYMPMMAGILKKVRNSKELSSLDAQVVYSNDKFTYRPGIDEVPVFEPDWFGDRGKAVGCYAVAKLRDGSAYVEVMNVQQIEQVRAVSRAKGPGPWVQWWDEMARKTALRRLCKRLPMSTDLESLIQRDDDLYDFGAVETPPARATVADINAKAAARKTAASATIVEGESREVPAAEGVVESSAEDDGVSKF